MDHEQERKLVTDIALTWIGTPCRFGHHLKGVGVDCGQLVAEIYREAGVIAADEAVGVFAPDWFQHTVEERYLRRVLRHAQLVAESTVYRTAGMALPGDVALVRAGKSRVYNHAGIVIRWPVIVHAVQPVVERADASRHPLWAYQQMAVLDPWRGKDAG